MTLFSEIVTYSAILEEPKKQKLDEVVFQRKVEDALIQLVERCREKLVSAGAGVGTRQITLTLYGKSRSPKLNEGSALKDAVRWAKEGEAF